MDRINNAKGDVELSEIIKSKDVKRSDLADIVKERDIRNANGKPVNVDSKGISKGQLALIIKRNLTGEKNVNVNRVNKIDKANNPVKKTIKQTIKDKKAIVDRIRKKKNASGDEVLAAQNLKVEIDKLESDIARDGIDVGATKGSQQREYSAKVVLDNVIENYKHHAKIEEVYRKIEELGEESSSIIKKDSFDPEQMARDLEAGKEISMDLESFDTAKTRGETRYHQLLENLKEEMGLEFIPERPAVQRAMEAAKDVIKKQGETRRFKELGLDVANVDFFGLGTLGKFIEKTFSKNKKGELSSEAILSVLNIREKYINPEKYIPKFIDPKQEAFNWPASAKDVKSNVLTYHRRSKAEMNTGAKKVQQWKDELPEEILEDITFAIELTDNIKTGESLSEVMQRIKDTPNGMKTYHHIKERFEKTRTEINEWLGKIKEEEAIAHIENYITHLYEGSESLHKSYVNRWKETSPNWKKRKYPTYEEAMKPVSEGGGGLTPKNLNSADLYQHYVDTNWRIASNNRIAHEMRNMVTEDGAAFALNGEQYNKLPDHMKKDYKELKSHFLRQSFSKEGIHYDGATYVYNGKKAFDTGLYNTIEAIYNPRGHKTNGIVANAYEQTSALMKHAQLLWSLFHHYNLTESSIIINGKAFNPIRGVFNIGEFDATLGRRDVGFTYKQGQRLLDIDAFSRDAIEHGLILGVHKDIGRTQAIRAKENFETGMGKLGEIIGIGELPGYEFLMKKMGKGKKFWDKQLWDNYHNPLKAATYYNKVAQLLKEYPELNPKQVKETVASHVNDAFGGLEWESIEIPPKAKVILQRGLLAADYTLANIRVKTKTGLVTGDKVQQKLHREYLVKSYLLQIGGATVISKAIFEAFGDKEKGDVDPIDQWKEFAKTGDLSALEIEKGMSLLHGNISITSMMRSMRDSLGIDNFNPENPDQEYYIQLNKQGREVERLFLDTKNYLAGKANPLIKKGYELVFNKSLSDFPQDLEGRTLTEEAWKKFKHVGKGFIPYAFHDNNFLFTFPKKKGMTNFKAGKMFTEALQTYADPTYVDKIYEKAGVQSTIPNYIDKDFLTEEYFKFNDGQSVSAALRKNGGHPKVKFDQARSNLLSKYYGDVWDKARKSFVKKGPIDVKKELTAIVRLGGSVKSIMQSYDKLLEKNPFLVDDGGNHKIDTDRITDMLKKIHDEISN